MFVLSFAMWQVAVTLIFIIVFALCSESLAPYRNLWDTWISRIGHIVVFPSIFAAFIVSFVDDGEGDGGNEKGYGRALVGRYLCWIEAVVAEGLATVCSFFSYRSIYHGEYQSQEYLDTLESINRSVERPQFRRGKQFLMPPQKHYVAIRDLKLA